MRKFVPWSLLTSLFLIISLFLKWPDQNLHIIACDVGQGDAILITHRSTQVLMDGGPNTQVLNCLGNHMPFWDRTIELVILTHPQHDHHRGLIDVFKSYEVTQFVASSIGNDSRSFDQLFATVVEEQVPVFSPKQGETIKVGKLTFKVLWPETRVGDSTAWNSKNSITLDQVDDNDQSGTVLGVYSGDPNEITLVTMLEFDRVRALFTGDIGTREELALVSSHLITPVNILKVPHHGSKNASSSDFLGVLSPEVAIISSGVNNTYGHPHQDTLIRLDTVGTQVLRTDQIGDVEVVSDGQQIWY
jgi:competence protein ComEC